MRPSLILVLVLVGCTAFPEVDAASRGVAGRAPALLPLDVILAAEEPAAEARGDALAAQAAALRGRATP